MDARRQGFPDRRGHVRDPASDRDQLPEGPRRPPEPRLDCNVLSARRRAMLARRPRRGRPRTRAQRRVIWQRTAIVVVIAALVAVVLGLAFAGSPSKLAGGVQIAGVEVGGKTPRQAERIL